MKKYYLFAGLALFAANTTGFAQTRIGAAGPPDSSAMLEITSGPSSNKGLLLPKMTAVQRNAIGGPAKGLMIYNLTANEVQVNIGTPASPIWVTATASNSGWDLTGNAGTNPTTNFIGTTDNQPMVVRTNNSEKLRVTSEGNIGIGTATPSFMLDVAGGIRLRRDSVQASNAGSSILWSSVNSGRGETEFINYHGTGSGGFRFYDMAPGIVPDSAVGEVMRITASGAVGIGTSEPAQLLDVAGTARISTATGTPTTITGRNAAGDIGNVTVGAGLSLAGGTLTATGGGTNDWDLTGNAGTNPATNFIGTSDNQPLVVRTNNTEKVRVTAAGNVGIGTNAPTSKLEVNSGGLTIANDATPLTAPAIHVINDGGGPGDNDNIVINSYGSNTQPSIGTSSARGTAAAPTNNQAGDNIGNFYFSSWVNGAESNQNIINSIYLGDGTNSKSRMNFSTSGGFAMAIDSSRNVGIGVLTPLQTLHVAGTARITTATGTPTTITGRNAAGDIGNVTVGAGLSLTAGTLSVTGGTNAWDLTGNAGTNPATNFIGTSDNQPIVVRTNNTEKVRVTAAGNVGIGTNAPTSKLNVDDGSLTVSSNISLASSAISVVNDGGGANLSDDVDIFSYGAATAPSYGMWTARGTQAAPANSQSGDYAGIFRFGTRLNGVATEVSRIQSIYLGNGTTAKSRLTFSTNTAGNNVMTIDSSSNVGIGVTSPQVKLQVDGGIFLAREDNLTHGNGSLIAWSSVRSGIGEMELINYHGTGTGGFRFYDVDPSPLTGTPVFGSNSIAFIAPVTGAYTNPSDARVKTNVQTINDGLEKVMKMHPVSYDFHSGRTMKNGVVTFTANDKATPTIGFLAQELMNVVPEAVIVPKDTANELYTVGYSIVIPVLTKAIQEQQKIIETLKAELAAVKNDNVALKADASKITELAEKMKQLEALLGTTTSGTVTASK